MRVDDDMLEDIKRLAKERYSTPSQVVRQAIAEYLNGIKVKARLTELIKASESGSS